MRRTSTSTALADITSVLTLQSGEDQPASNCEVAACMIEDALFGDFYRDDGVAFSRRASMIGLAGAAVVLIALVVVLVVQLTVGDDWLAALSDTVPALPLAAIALGVGWVFGHPVNLAGAYKSLTQQQRALHLAAARGAHHLRMPCIFLLVAARFFEVPGWCARAAVRAGVSNLSWSSIGDLCPTPDGSHMFLSGLPAFPRMMGSAVDAVLLLLLAYTNVAESRTRGWHQQHWPCKVRVVFLVGCLLDLVLFVTFAVFASMPPAWRSGPYLYIGLLAISPEGIKVCRALLDTMVEFSKVAGLAVLAILLITWVCVTLLNDLNSCPQLDNSTGTPQCLPTHTVPTSTGYDTFGHGVRNVFFIMTGSGYPGPVIPTAVESVGYSMMFLLITFFLHFLILGLILAVVYNTYSESLRSRYHDYFTNRARGLGAAFDRLSDPSVADGEVTKPCIVALCAEISKHPQLNVEAEHVDLLFATLDDNSSGTIDKAEFLELFDVLQYQFQRVPIAPWVARACPALAQTSAYRGFRALFAEQCYADWDEDRKVPYWEVRPWWRVARHAVMVVNAAVLLFWTIQDVGDNLHEESATWWRSEVAFKGIVLGFAFWYTVSMATTLSVISFEHFWLDTRNRFDLVVTVILLVAAVVERSATISLPGCSTPQCEMDLLRHVCLLRCARLLAAVNHVPQLSLMSKCLIRILPASASAIMLLVGFMYVWGIYGVQRYGGLEYNGGAHFPDYMSEGLDIYNFNDLFLAVMTLWAFIVGGPIQEMVSEFNVRTGGRHDQSDWNETAMYFLSFYIVGVLVCVNIFSAFIIDSFLLMKGDVEKGLQLAEAADPLAGMKSMDAEELRALGITPELVSAVSHLVTQRGALKRLMQEVIMSGRHDKQFQNAIRKDTNDFNEWFEELCWVEEADETGSVKKYLRDHAHDPSKVDPNYHIIITQDLSAHAAHRRLFQAEVKKACDQVLHVESTQRVRPTGGAALAVAVGGGTRSGAATPLLSTGRSEHFDTTYGSTGRRSGKGR